MGIRNVNVAKAGVAEIRREKSALFSRWHFSDDFAQVAGSALQPYWTTAVGGAGTVSIPAVVQNGGIVRLDTVAGGAGVDFARLIGCQHAVDFDLEPDFWFLFRPNRVTQCGLYVGLQRDADEFAFLAFDTSLGHTTWHFISNDTTGAVDLTSAFVPVADRWYEVRMNVRNQAGGTQRFIYARLYDRTSMDAPGEGILLTSGASVLSASDLYRAYVSSESQGAIISLDVDYYQSFGERWA